MNDEEAARHERAERLRKKISETSPPVDGGSVPPPAESPQQPDESDAAYVRRRMREIDRKGPPKPT